MPGSFSRLAPPAAPPAQAAAAAFQHRPLPSLHAPATCRPQRLRRPPRAFLEQLFLAAPPQLLPPPPPEVVMPFVTTTSLASAPQCLLSFGLERGDLLAPAPQLRAGEHRFLGSAAWQRAEQHEAAWLDVAACLAQPTVLEENAADVLRETAEEVAQGQQESLQLR